jgi:hypothetical protein
MSCPECKEHKLKTHQFETPTDYELHAETALSDLYSNDNFMSTVMDELLYTLDQMERPEKNKLMAGLLDQTPDYKKYLTQTKQCNNIKGCKGKNCHKDCLSFKTFNDLDKKDKIKVKMYADLFYGR